MVWIQESVSNTDKKGTTFTKCYDIFDEMLFDVVYLLAFFAVVGT